MCAPARPVLVFPASGERAASLEEPGKTASFSPVPPACHKPQAGAVLPSCIQKMLIFPHSLTDEPGNGRFGSIFSMC